MKKFFILFLVMFVGPGYATTVNIDWVLDGNNFAQTTCQTGGDLILPATTPTKRGYVFRGWQYDVLYGSVSQSGTPTPTNPIYPVFVPLGNTVLRAIGGDSNLIADSYDPTTGKITRRVGMRVLNGTETITDGGSVAYWGVHYTYFNNIKMSSPLALYSHWIQGTYSSSSGSYASISGTTYFAFNKASLSGITTTEAVKQWIAAQYEAGTPVTVYYPLKTPVEEIYAQ